MTTPPRASPSSSATRSRQPHARGRAATSPASSPVEPDLVVDLADLGAALLDWEDPGVADLVAQVGGADLVVVASPTYKATYTGLLKLFLDRFSTTGLSGVAVPLMLGAGPTHALAPELTLRPVLTEIGGTVPVRGLYVHDAAYDDPAAYAAGSRPLVPGSRRCCRARGRARMTANPFTTNQDLDVGRPARRRSASSPAGSSPWPPRSTGSWSGWPRARSPR